MTQIVLASGSPRRAKILAAHGVAFTVLKTDAPETAFPHDPERTVLENARAKRDAALAALAAKRFPNRAPCAAVIAADTIVWLDGRIYGKPRDLAEAAVFLRELSGRTHVVFTGVACTDAAGRLCEVCAKTYVTFRDLDDETIAEYVRRVNPVDRAGAYDVDESGDLLVASFDGSYENVMGLPFDAIAALGVFGA